MLLRQVFVQNHVLHIIGLCAALLLCQAAWAANLTSAKQAGLIGEQPNGYLGLVVATAPADVRALRADVNKKRLVHYQKIARANGLSLSSVEKLAGKKAIKKTQSGQFIRLASGQWTRK